MSEYQYYEFQAVDRPLTKAEMAEVRAFSTRAEITPTRFMNIYNYGDFHGSPERLIEKYYDAFLYEANWGTRQLMLRLPRQLVNVAGLDRYAGEDDYNGLTIRETGDHVILNFATNDEDGGGWIEVEDSEAWLPTLLPIREAIANGDLRALYLGWLIQAQLNLGSEEDEEEQALAEELEPPVPPSLANLTPELERLVEFFEIDEDLLAVAAERSAPLGKVGASRTDVENWLASLPEAEKNALLIRLLDEDPRFLKVDIQNRFRLTHPPKRAEASARTGRTRGELLRAAIARRKARKIAERQRQAEEHARKEREATIARQKYLESLAGKEESLWQRIEAQAELKNASGYDEATRLLTDLRDLAARSNQSEAFRARLAQFCERHARKPALQARLQKLG